MKKKIAELEGSLADQNSNIETIDHRFASLESIIGPSGAGLSEVVEVILSPAVAKINEQIEAMKAEMNHKFGLQIAENKRMQQHLSTSKRENQAMKNRLVALEERVKNLELELGGDDEYDDEEEAKAMD